MWFNRRGSTRLEDGGEMLSRAQINLNWLKQETSKAAEIPRTE